MILKKIIIGLLIGCFLSGCAQSVALLGPASTLAYTGSVTQAGLSYGTSKAIKKVTGKTTTENIKDFMNDKKNEEEDENYDKVFQLVKNNIEKTSKILNQSNQ